MRLDIRVGSIDSLPPVDGVVLERGNKEADIEEVYLMTEKVLPSLRWFFQLNQPYCIDLDLDEHKCSPIFCTSQFRSRT